MSKMKELSSYPFYISQAELAPTGITYMMLVM
jgi:hypothetical protein